MVINNSYTVIIVVLYMAEHYSLTLQIVSHALCINTVSNVMGIGLNTATDLHSQGINDQVIITFHSLLAIVALYHNHAPVSQSLYI